MIPAPSTSVAPATVTNDARAQLLAIGRSALTALLDLIPRAVWRGLKGWFGGFFAAGFLGLALAGAAAIAAAIGLLVQPRWLVLVSLAWVPFVFALAGGYVGALNGFLSAIADEVERRGLAARIFAVVKPVCLAVAAKARGGGEGEIAFDLRRALGAELDEGSRGEEGASLGARAERFLAARSNRLLCFSVVRSVVTAGDRESAIREMETLGVERLTVILVETIEDLFSMQIHVAAAGALVAAAVPGIVFAVIR